MTRTRIVATLGPASRSEETIAELIASGVNLFRLNFSHGTRAEHGETIRRIRKVAGNHPTAVLQDLGGPKLRLSRPVAGEPGDIVELSLPDSVKEGDPVLLADGLMQLEVVDAGRSRVLVGGKIPAGKGINLPSSRLDVPSLTEKDREDLAFGVAQNVDFVALSFVRTASDLDEVKKSGIPVIAKIEKARAVEEIEDILAAADGIMVARGDLGVEIPIERVPLVQKRLIHLANREGKPVITATQMLRSMVESRIPTRAEATDVSNAVLDGTDAVMLSEETAVGKHPRETVRVMRRILDETEKYFEAAEFNPTSDTKDMICHAADMLAVRSGAAAIVVPTRSGFTARMVSRFRPAIPIIALTPSDEVRRRLSLSWGVTAVTVPWYDGGESVLDRFREPVLETGLVKKGETVVVTAGWPFAQPGITNLVHLATI